MLLRSSSTPALNSGISQFCKDSSPEPEPILHMISRTRSCSPICLSSSMCEYNSLKKMSRGSLSDTDLKKVKKPSRECISMHDLLTPIAVDEEEHEKESDEAGLDDRLLFVSNTGSNLEEGAEAGLQTEMSTEVMMGGGSGGGGGRICCGGGAGDDNGGDSEYGDSDHRRRNTDLYYKKIIKANPGNPLLLSNYARYLKEVCADFVKAKEYCGRAVMATPDDGSILSLYAELIWQTQEDPILAENYFDQAIKSAPEDCYVLASYANFLWDAEQDDEVEMIDVEYTSQPNSSFGGASTANNCSILG